MEGPIPVTRHLTQPVGRRAAVAQDARCLAMFPGFGVLTWAGRLASAISSPSRLPGADFQCLHVKLARATLEHWARRQRRRRQRGAGFDRGVQAERHLARTCVSQIRTRVTGACLTRLNLEGRAAPS